MKLFIKHFIFFGLLVFAAPAFAVSFFDQFTDPKDGKFDTSEWIIEKKGFLPVPIFITEPAVGYGAGAALLFFHQSAQDARQKEDRAEAGGDATQKEGDQEDDRLGLPPSISAVVGAYTENDSWFLGGGHFGSWRDDRIRYVGILGTASFNLKFYGAGNRPLFDQRPLHFNIDGTFLHQEMTFRLLETNLFAGARYTYLTSETTFDFSIPWIPKIQLDSSDAGLDLILNYDSRDNIFTANRGHHAKLDLSKHDESLGGDFDYTKIKAQSLSWWGLHPDVVLGVRLDGRFSNGDVPFYALPYIDLRGIPAMRYQGDEVFVAEIEPRWDVTNRWSLVGFVGLGWAADSVSEFNNSDEKVAGGVGFRYLVARRMGLRTGIDIARGPEDTVFYITVGSGWQ